MQEQVNEKISLLIDDELQHDQALSLLRGLQQDEDARLTLERYQLISQVLKNDNCLMLNKQFADKIQQQLNYEPVWLLPVKKPVINWQKTSLAIAASITLAMVWIVHKLDKDLHTNPVPIMVVESQRLSPQAIDPRLNDYLQAHDNTIYSNNLPTAHPYARVVGYQQ